MIKTNENKAGIIGVINMARLIYSFIGKYEEHYIFESNYIVKLTDNCKIVISKELVQDFYNGVQDINKPGLIQVVNSFCKV